MSLDQFYAKYNTGQPIPNYMGTFPGQCVSLISMYLHDCFNLSPLGWGNAVDYYLIPNPMLLTDFDKIYTTDFQDGDILVWGDDPGTFTNIYGHIAIWYKGKIMNQNNNGRMYLTLDNFFSGGFLGVLRPKGGNMATITTEAVVALSIATTGKQPSNDDEKKYINQPATQENIDGLITYWAGKSTVRSLTNQLVAANKKSITLKSGLYKVN